MSKIGKSAVIIISLIFFSELLKNSSIFQSTIGIIGIYLSVYYFLLTNIGKEQEFNLKEIITILIAYNLQKSPYLLHRSITKENIYLIPNMFMIILFLGLFLYNLYKNKKINKKEIINLCYEYLVISLPFYLIKAKGRQTLLIVCFMFIFKIFLKKEYVFDKEIKKIYYSVFLVIICFAISFIGNETLESQFRAYEDFVENLIYLLCFIQIKLSKEELKKSMVVGLTSSIIPITPIIVEMLKLKSFNYRLGEQNPNIWGLEAVIWTIIFLYLIFYKNKKEYVTIYLLYIVGVFVSGSRAAILAMIIISAFLLFYRNRKVKKYLLFIICLFLVLNFSILKTDNRISDTYKLIKNEKKLDSSSQIRVLIYKEAWNQFKEKPIKGFGFNGYKFNSVKRNIEGGNKNLNYLEKNAYSQAHAHNNILDILCTTGILGAVSYMSMLFFVICKILKNKSDEKIFILSIIAAYEMCGLVDCSLYYRGIQLFIYFIVGLYIAYVTPKINFSKKEKIA